MDAKFDSALTRKLSAFVKLSDEELDLLSDLRSRAVKIERGRELAEEGETNPKAFVLQAGWGCSYKIMPDGGRQIIAFPIPGDCVGMHSMLLRTSDLSFSALTMSRSVRLRRHDCWRPSKRTLVLLRPSCGPSPATRR